MEKHITNERTGINYTLHGDYYLPDLEYPSVEREIGVFGMRHKRYIEEHRSGFFSSLVLSGKLYDYLADIDEQANDSLLRLVDGMAGQEGVTEQLKEEDMMEWVRKMNNIRNRAMSIINNAIIYNVNRLGHINFHSTEPPKIFWKYYDEYRRGVITINKYSELTSISVNEILLYIIGLV